MSGVETIGSRAFARSVLVLRRAVVLLLVAGLFGLSGVGGLPRAAAAESWPAVDGAFPLTGHGFGHGRGLSQWGAYVAARGGVSATHILNFYYPGTATAGYGNPTLRVHLTADDGGDLVVIRNSRTGSLGVVDWGTTRRDIPLPGTVDGHPVGLWRAVAVGGGLTRLEGLWAGAWRGYPSAAPWTSDGAFEFVSSAGRMTLVYPGNAQRDYRGSLRSVPSAGGVLSQNLVPMESYLRSVVPSESPSSWPAAALQAQAVAARTYTANVRTPGAVSDICDTTRCQVYSGVAAYDSSGRLVRTYEAASTDAAVAATAGQVRTYGGSPIFAQYSASNGGWSTAGTATQPYLVAQEDRWDASPLNAARDWTATLTADRIGAAFGTGPARSLTVERRDGRGEWGGRVLSVTVHGRDRSATVSGEAFRSALGLRSTWWTVTRPPAQTDLHAVRLRGGASGAVEVHTLSQSSDYRSFTTHAATAFAAADPADWRFFLAPYGGSGRPDLYGVKLRGTASGRLEVHVLSAASDYRTFVAHIATAQPALPAGKGVDVALAQFAGSGVPDVHLVEWEATGSGRVEVHVLSAAAGYRSFLAHTATALPVVTAGHWAFTVDPAGSADLFGIKHAGGTGSGRTEIHVLTRASGYRTFASQVATPLGQVPTGAFAFHLGDLDHDGRQDMFAIKRAGSSASTEVHVLSGAAGYTDWLLHAATGLHPTTTDWAFDVG